MGRDEKHNHEFVLQSDSVAAGFWCADRGICGRTASTSRRGQKGFAYKNTIVA